MCTANDVVAPDRELIQAAMTSDWFVEAFGRWEKERAAESGTSASRLKLVYHLHCEGPQKMAELAQHLAVTPRNVTALVDGLEGEGYLERTPHPTDRRATLIRLSSSGDDLAARFETYSGELLALFETLTRDDQRTLARILGQLLEEIESR